jgi:hypothetical protein
MKVAMKVAVKAAVLVGMLMLNVIAGFYEGEWRGHADASDLGQVKTCDGPFPPPTWP